MRHLLLAIITAITISSCSSIKIHSEKDGDVDFTQFETLSYFGWQEESDKILNRFDKERIELAFADEFKKRGITVVERDGDIIVARPDDRNTLIFEAQS